MDNTYLIAQVVFKENRWKILKYCMIIGLFSSCISLLFQIIGFPLISIGVILIVNILFIFGLNVIFIKSVLNDHYDYHTIFLFKKYWKPLVCLFATYLTVFVLFLVSMVVCSRFKYGLLIIPMIGAFFVLSMNCMNHLCIFAIYNNEKNIFKILKESAKVFIGQKKLFILMILKSFIYMIIGSFIVFTTNVFIYARQINTILEQNTIIQDKLFDPIFSSNISYLIQSTGIQLVASYIMIFTGIHYAAIYLKKVK